MRSRNITLIMTKHVMIRNATPQELFCMIQRCKKLLNLHDPYVLAVSTALVTLPRILNIENGTAYFLFITHYDYIIISREYKKLRYKYIHNDLEINK